MTFDPLIERAIRRLCEANRTDPYLYGRLITRLRNGIITRDELLDPKKTPYLL